MINKKLYLPILCLLALLQTVYGQTPEGINYQAVARDGNGDILANQAISVRFTILENSPTGTTVYQETHATSTNDFGLFSEVIGEGVVVSGTFANIDWGNDNHYLEVVVDIGTGLINLGTTQLMSVPYALYAKEAGGGGGTYQAGTGIDISGSTITNTGDTDPSDDVTTGTSAGGDVSGTFSNLQVVGLQGRTLSGIAPTSGQVLKWNGNVWEPANDIGGGSGDNWGTQVVETDATLSGDGTGGNTLGLAQQGAANGEVLMWNGSQWTPATPSGGSGLWQRNGNYVFNLDDSIGIGVLDPMAKLHVDGNESVIFGGLTGDKLVWIADKGSFRAGIFTNGGLEPDSVGSRSVAFGQDTKAMNSYAAAFGKDTRASGLYSFAAGLNAIASQNSSVAMGRETVASGFQSTAMGALSIASGSYSTAMGNNTQAIGNNSTALGINSIASGHRSTAIGVSTTASGSSSTAMGENSSASGVNATAMGYNTEASGSHSTAMGYSTTANALYSTSLGRNSLASGKTAIAMGEAPIATGDYSLATGNNTWAAGHSATAMGNNTYAPGDASFAGGEETKSIGNNSTALGYKSVATGPYSIAAGILDSALGNSSVALGRFSLASGDYSFAAGEQTTASGDHSAAMGFGTKAIGRYAFAFGVSTEASGSASVAMGYASDAVGDDSKALGSWNKAIGEFSSAMGWGDSSIGDYSLAMGYRTIANSAYEVVLGRYNQTYSPNSTTGWDPDDRLFVIGSGSSASSRRNAVTILKNGNVGIGTNVPTEDFDIRADTMRIDVAGTEDFFFTKYTSQSVDHPLFVLNDFNGMDNGYIGIPSIPFWNVYSHTFYALAPANYLSYSDREIKENIRPYQGALSKVMQIHSVTYDLKKEYYYKGQTDNTNLSEAERKDQIGFIAQDVEKVLPQLVKEDKDSGLKSVGYMGLIPVLVEAIKEQQAEIESLQQENDELRKLKDQYQALEQRLSALESQ